ncbi:MAG: TonB family protein [Arcicella sp.]|nr:TonB family protein [Arcicella sp.]
MKTNNNISPETIKAYLAGTLSHAQTHEFEKAMLNDAVLRDMVEGYEISRGVNIDFISVNDSLSARLKDRVGKEKQEIYPLWKRVPVYARAASVLLFLGIGIYFLTKNNTLEFTEKMTSVQSSESEKLPQIVPPITVENEPIVQENNVISTQKIKVEMDKIQVEKKDFAVKESEAQAGNYDQIKKDEEVAAADKNEEKIEPEIAPKPEPAVAYEAPPAPALQAPKAAAPVSVMKSDEVYSRNKAKISSLENRASKIEQPTSNIVILDEDSNKPVPNVSIISEDKTIGKTDVNGRFNVENSLKADKLKLVAPDFENTEIIVNKTNSDMFYIRPKSELIFIDLKRNKTWKYNPSEHPAQPSVSPDEYLEYLQRNLKKSKQALENQIVGTVEVEFSVNKKGELLDFKIIKSLGYGCDEEAIRLIREGPKWLPKTYGGMTGRQRVRQVVNF